MDWSFDLKLVLNGEEQLLLVVEETGRAAKMMDLLGFYVVAERVDDGEEEGVAAMGFNMYWLYRVHIRDGCC